MKSKQKISVTKEREVFTYAELWHTSKCLLEKGQTQPEASTHQFRASLAFTAFTLEAYLNHLGRKLFQCWDDLERLGPKEKLNVIAERAGVKIEYGKRPWQVLKGLFGFRNDIAHGKSGKLKSTKLYPSHRHNLTLDLIQTEWEAFCTRENAQRARTDVEQIVRELHKAAAVDTRDPFRPGLQGFLASAISE